MNVTIKPSTLSGVISAPPSKSYAHRVLISAFLSGETVTVKNVGNSKDVQATLGALASLGAKVEINENSVVISRNAAKDGVTVNCGESGSTLRFLLPVACGLGIKASFTGEGRLLQRPIKELIETLNENGAEITDLTVSGKLTAGEYRISANISSQYLTGLMLALPLLNGDSKIILVGPSVSTGYLDITLDVLKAFGIVINKTVYGYEVPGNQKYVSSNTVTIEGDYSGAAFMLSAGAMCGSVTVNGLKADSKQGDAEIVEVLKKFGADVTVTQNSITVKKAELNAINLDCENIPDLVQVISVVASIANGVTLLKNVDRLRLKESDRISAIINQLQRAGIKCVYIDGNLYVYGGKPIGAEFSGGADHRTVMSASILSICCKGESKVIGAEPVSKSYTTFFEDLRSLGGKCNVCLEG